MKRKKGGFEAEEDSAPRDDFFDALSDEEKSSGEEDLDPEVGT